MTPDDTARLAALRASVEKLPGFGGWAVRRKDVLGIFDDAIAAGVTLARPAPDAALAPHPGENHQYRMTCLRCGEPGFLFVGFHSPGESFTWTGVAALAPEAGG